MSVGRFLLLVKERALCHVVIMFFQKKSFDRFYKKHVEKIYRHVYFRVGQNTALAQDLVSDIFFKALRAYDRYDPSISESAWIYTIARNHLANYYRDKKETVDINDVVLSACDEHVDVDVRRILETLDPITKELVTMKYLEGYTYKEMAEILGKSAGSLKMAVSRALQAIKHRHTL